MKSITVNLFSFDELSEKAKQTAIQSLSDINVDYEWWDSTCEDAAGIGLKITGFNLRRGGCVDGEFTLSANEVCVNILNEHGEACATHTTATDFMAKWQPVFSNYMDETHETYESSESEDVLQEMEDDFRTSLCEDYLIILKDEYDYLTSDEAIIDSIQGNEFYFTEDGKEANL